MSRLCSSFALGAAAIVATMPAMVRAQASGSLLIAPVLPPGFASVENQGVAERARPDWQALGVRLGAFTLRPTASVAGGGTSNAYLARDDSKGSTFVSSSTSFDLTSGWSRHYVSLRANGQLNRFVQNGAANTISWSLAASGRYDIHSTLQVAGTGDVTRDNESRFSGEATSANFVVSPFIRETAAVRVNYNPGRGGVQFSANYRHLHFLPVTLQGGARADQSFRDRTLADVALQGTFARTPSFALFAQAGVSRTQFDVPDPALLLQGNSVGMRLLGGVNLELEGVATGSIGVGWSRRDYADSRIGRHSGLSVEALLELLPDNMTTITLNARRQLSDANPTTGPFWETLAGATIDRELRRNIVVSATTGYTRQRYLDEGARGGTAYVSGLSGTYLISRRMEARASIIYRASHVKNTGSLTEARGTIGLTFKI